MGRTRQNEWQGAELVWIRPSDIIVPHCILDQEQAEALRVLIAPEWELNRVFPVPVADEGLPEYRALSGAHRVGVAKELEVDDPGYLVPCVMVPCPPGDYKSMVRVSDLELVDWLHRLGMHAAAEATSPQLLRLQSG
ncbi:hypothetical protein ACFLSJ_05580 [Verrucomicrobiota bacterium]